MKEKKIVFRCKGGKDIGWGHVKRCLNIAQWLRGKYKVYFVVNQDAEVAAYIKDKGFTVFEIRMKDDPAKAEDLALNTVLGFDPYMVINDIQDTDTRYMQELKSKGIKIVVFDDTTTNVKMAHIFVDANKKEKEGKCFGPRYAVLSSVYPKLRKKARTVHKKVRTIVIACGGSDPAQVSEKILRSLCGKISDSIEIQVIVGPDYVPEKKASLYEWGKQYNVVYYESVEDISPYLDHADIAIVGGGLTMFESLCLATPTVVVAQNKAQAKNARKVEKKDLLLNLGEAEKISDKKIMRKVAALIDDFEGREKMAHTAREAIDGKGLFRVLEQIEALM